MNEMDKIKESRLNYLKWTKLDKKLKKMISTYIVFSIPE